VDKILLGDKHVFDSKGTGEFRVAEMQFIADVSPGFTVKKMSQYDVDFHMWRENKFVAVADIEHRSCWKTEEFPFPDKRYHVLNRKEHWSEQYKVPFFYVVYNLPCQFGWIIDWEVAADYPIYISKYYAFERGVLRKDWKEQSDEIRLVPLSAGSLGRGREKFAKYILERLKCYPSSM
jgi:hypothetical protein